MHFSKGLLPQGSHPCFEIFELEGLVDPVVGREQWRRHFIQMFADTRQHQYLRSSTVGALRATLDTATNFPAAHARHHHIKHGEIAAVRLRDFPCVIAITGFEDLAAQSAYAKGDERAQFGLIVGNKDT